MARHGDRDVVYVEREDGGSSFKWLMIGAALGAGLALLFAPSSGRELRKEIRRGVRRARDLAEEAVGELKESFGAGDEDSHRGLDRGGVYEADEADEEDDDGAGEEAPAGRPSVRAAREELEQRLAAARARRRRALAGDEETVA